MPMSLSTIVLLILAALVFIALPIAMIWSIVDYFRGKGSDRRGSGGISAGVGAALQEVDRLMARPSAEFTIEAETPTLKRDDDSGGE